MGNNFLSYVESELLVAILINKKRVRVYYPFLWSSFLLTQTAVNSSSRRHSSFFLHLRAWQRSPTKIIKVSMQPSEFSLHVILTKENQQECKSGEETSHTIFDEQKETQGKYLIICYKLLLLHNTCLHIGIYNCFKCCTLIFLSNKSYSVKLKSQHVVFSTNHQILNHDSFNRSFDKRSKTLSIKPYEEDIEWFTDTNTNAIHTRNVKLSVSLLTN